MFAYNANLAQSRLNQIAPQRRWGCSRAARAIAHNVIEKAFGKTAASQLTCLRGIIRLIVHIFQRLVL